MDLSDKMWRKREKCKFCGGSHFILSTEKEGKKLVCGDLLVF